MQKIILTILDGCGISDDKYGNAVKLAKMPNFNELWDKYPHSLLNASGNDVGLPEGQMGNSEVGHLNIGAGRIVYQPLEQINNSISNKTFFANKEILKVINHTKKYNSKLHIFGLLSDGGVHSHIDHLFALIDMCKKENVHNVYYHVFLDGRDTLPNVKDKFLNLLAAKIESSGIGKIASIAGRYYAMDRDNRWDRVEKEYNIIVNGIGRSFSNYHELLEATTKSNETDEFVVPTLIDKKGLIEDNDGLITFNFRPDRLRELFTALTNNSFSDFKVKRFNNIELVTMFSVSEDVICSNAFTMEKLTNTFGEYISKLGLKQLRIAETEKYAHVTYFFDGGVEKKLNNCQRILIPSAKVATYDLKPEMSCFEITDALLKELPNVDVVILNYANCDMVGHTGNLKATIKAVEAVDYNLGRLYEMANKLGFTMVIIADHGNCEEMLDKDGNVLTAHTTNKVPLLITKTGLTLSDGKLADVAPTMLKLMNIPIPKEMTGINLIK